MQAQPQLDLVSAPAHPTTIHKPGPCSCETPYLANIKYKLLKSTRHQPLLT
jgi:hypothetical protein